MKRSKIDNYKNSMTLKPKIIPKATKQQQRPQNPSLSNQNDSMCIFDYKKVDDDMLESQYCV